MRQLGILLSIFTTGIVLYGISNLNNKKTSSIVLLLLFISLVLLLGYYYYDSNQKRIKSDILRNITNSNGTFDAHAQQALENINELHNLAPRDEFNRARLIYLNINEGGEVNNIEDLNNIVQGYHNALINGDNELEFFELDQIENFINMNPRLAQEIDIRNNIVNLHNIPDYRAKQIQKTMEQSKNETVNKTEALDKFTESNIVHSNDSQNVHDSGVNHQLKEAFRKLKDESPYATRDSPRINTEIHNYIISNIKDINKKNNAMKALDAIKGNNAYNSSIDAKEQDLLNLVWTRSDIRDNIKNKDLIRDAIIDALADMSTSLGTVCNSGRCTRLMGSLTLLDSNQDVANGFLTVEAIRNDMLNKSNEILKLHIEETKNGDSNLKNVAKSYENPDITVSDEDETAFKNDIIEKIKTSLDDEYKDKISESDYNRIKDYCVSTIESI